VLSGVTVGLGRSWRPGVELWQAAAVSAPATHETQNAAPTDAELVAALRARDPAALGVLYDRHASALLGLAMRMLRERGEAEDLVHDVFVEAWRSAGAFEAARGSLVTWLTVRLRSRAIDRLRRRVADPARLADAPASVEAAGTLESTAPGRSVDQARARAALVALSSEQREVVQLAYFAGLTFREIAERLGVPASTAKSRMVAAMRILRERLAEPRGDT